MALGNSVISLQCVFTNHLKGLRQIINASFYQSKIAITVDKNAPVFLENLIFKNWLIIRRKKAGHHTVEAALKQQLSS